MMILDRVRENYIGLWGPPAQVRPLQSARYHIDIFKWDAGTHPEEVTMYATLGASVFPQPGHAPTHRFEFYSGLLPEQDGMAVVLADVATYSVDQQTPIGPGHTITFHESLWPGTPMCSVMLQRSDVGMIPMLSSTDEGVHVEYLAVTPLYPSEMRFKQEHSLDALIEHWWKHNVRFWDPNRPPEPA